MRVADGRGRQRALSFCKTSRSLAGQTHRADAARRRIRARCGRCPRRRDPGPAGEWQLDPNTLTVMMPFFARRAIRASALLILSAAIVAGCGGSAAPGVANFPPATRAALDNTITQWL